MLLSFLLAPWFIRELRRKQIGQVVRDEGPASHRAKAGTPTMGGLLILAAALLPTLLWADLSNVFIWIAVLSTAAFGGIGLLDDRDLEAELGAADGTDVAGGAGTDHEDVVGHGRGEQDRPAAAAVQFGRIAARRSLARRGMPARSRRRSAAAGAVSPRCPTMARIRSNCRRAKRARI